VCLLDEQSRMAGPISDMVSHLFYDGELRVAADVLNGSAWLAARRFEFGSIASSEHVSLLMVAENGVWSHAFRGPIRYGSADLIAHMLKVVADKRQVAAKDIIILTPFRAQRALLRQRLNAHGVKNIKVSTVHRAQGSEAQVVIFDPADAANTFLLTDEAKRLINVALSRAQAKLVLVLSPGDAANPVFAQILNRVRLAHDPRIATPIAELVHLTGFPGCAVGRRVAIARHVGEVSRVARDGAVLWMLNEQTGAEQSFDVTVLRRNSSQLADEVPVSDSAHGHKPL
jgi:hypothetical protein